MLDETIYEEVFPQRLAELRLRKGVSARDMSLSIGQNAGYINNIESGKALPSMSAFFYICDFLGITPSQFFDLDSPNPKEIADMIRQVKSLSQKDFDSISSLVSRLSDSE